jgi:hypothetical protein
MPVAIAEQRYYTNTCSDAEQRYYACTDTENVLPVFLDCNTSMAAILDDVYL